MDALETAKIHIKFAPNDHPENRIYVFIVAADGKRFLNMLLSVTYVKKPLDSLSKV